MHLFLYINLLKKLPWFCLIAIIKIQWYQYKWIVILLINISSSDWAALDSDTAES